VRAQRKAIAINATARMTIQSVSSIEKRSTSQPVTIGRPSGANHRTTLKCRARPPWPPAAFEPAQSSIRVPSRTRN
jgi:hypothetical protein